MWQPHHCPESNASRTLPGHVHVPVAMRPRSLPHLRLELLIRVVRLVRQRCRAGVRAEGHGRVVAHRAVAIGLDGAVGANRPRFLGVAGSRRVVGLGLGFPVGRRLGDDVLEELEVVLS